MLRVNTRVETQGDRTGGEERLSKMLDIDNCRLRRLAYLIGGIGYIQYKNLFPGPVTTKKLPWHGHTKAATATTLDHNMVYVPGKNLKLRPLYAHKKGAKSVKSVKPAHLNSMPASDEDPEHTNGRAVTRRPTLDHNMVYVAGKYLELHPFHCHRYVNLSGIRKV